MVFDGCDDFDGFVGCDDFDGFDGCDDFDGFVGFAGVKIFHFLGID